MARDAGAMAGGGTITGVARNRDMVIDSLVQMKLCIEETEGNSTEVLTTVRRWSRSSAIGGADYGGHGTSMRN
jgi:hypothetical protein